MVEEVENSSTLRENSHGSGFANADSSVYKKHIIVEAAAQDINSLEIDSKTKALFDEFLREISSDISKYLKIGKRNSEELFELFSNYRVTLDPKIGWQYDTDGNAFTINLLDLLYTPAWRLASAFVHEAEHVWFLKRKGMLNAPEHKQEEFAQSFRRESEITALKAEIAFLLSIRQYVQPTTRVLLTKKQYLHSITGTPITRKGYLPSRIDTTIKKVKNTLRELKESGDPQAKKFSEDVRNCASHNHALIASGLGIELPKPDSEGKYKTLQIVFQKKRD